MWCLRESGSMRNYPEWRTYTNSASLWRAPSGNRAYRPPIASVLTARGEPRGRSPLSDPRMCGTRSSLTSPVPGAGPHRQARAAAPRPSPALTGAAASNRNPTKNPQRMFIVVPILPVRVVSKSLGRERFDGPAPRARLQSPVGDTVAPVAWLRSPWVLASTPLGIPLKSPGATVQLTR